MKTFIIICLIIVVAVVAGGVTFTQTSGKATITIDKTEINKDVSNAAEEGKKIIRKAEENLRKETRDRPVETPSGP